MRPRSLAIIGSTAAVAGGLFLFLPLSYSHQATFVIEAANGIKVRVGTDGFIGSVAVKEGDTVKRGALLAVMQDPDLEQKRNSIEAELSLLERQIVQKQAQGATAESLKDQRHREQIGRELADTEARLDELRITAPEAGVIVTRNVSDKVGQMLKQGEEFCELADVGRTRARVVVDDWDLEDVRIGSRAALRLNGAPDLRISGRVVTLSPASELHQRLSPVAEFDKTAQQSLTLTKGKFAGKKLSAREQAEAQSAAATSPFEAPLTRFEAVIEIDEATGDVKPGMTGDIKIYGHKRPLAARAWRDIRDWFRSKIWW